MPPQLTPPPLPGDQVGQYLLGDMLGVGGMATVYRATSPDHGRVALKVLHPGKAGTEEDRRFRREFLALEGLRHPGIVAVHEHGRHGDYPWFAMELVDGMDLGTLLEQWAEDNPVDRFDRVERIRSIPAFAVHGRYDIVCAVKNLIDLKQAWPELDCAIAADSGHSSHEPGITRELVAATRRIAKTGDPRRQAMEKAIKNINQKP